MIGILCLPCSGLWADGDGESIIDTRKTCRLLEKRSYLEQSAFGKSDTYNIHACLCVVPLLRTLAYPLFLSSSSWLQVLSERSTCIPAIEQSRHIAHCELEKSGETSDTIDLTKRGKLLPRPHW